MEVSEATFEHAVIARSHDVPVVVDFWAPWCGPCRMLGPLLERLAAEGRGAFLLAKLNVDDNPNLSMQYAVRGIPAVKAFKAGKVVAEFVGNQPEGKVREFIQNIAPSAADRALAQATSLLATRHWAQAEATFRRVLADQPHHGAATLGLIKALAAQGRGCEVETLLDGFPSSDEIAAAEKLRPLARALCQVETGDAPIDETDLDALYHNSVRLLARGQTESGLDGLLDVLRQDKKYRQGEARGVMLGVFELLGEDDPLTRAYRSELASVLF
jgi:putative thioredoxin